MRILIFFLIFLIAAFFIGGLLIPKEWSVSRSVTIQASPEKIYPFISDFKEWDKWSPWNATKDPSMQYSYSGPETGVGAKRSWTSEKMGTGWMELTTADPQTGISYDLFIEMGNEKTKLHGIIALQATGNETQVTWTDQGSTGNSFKRRWLSLMLKQILGKDLESGLNQLKTVVEQPSANQE